MDIYDSFIKFHGEGIEISCRDGRVLKIKKQNDSISGIEDFVMVVPPYMFEYESFCKLRWRGRTLRELFTNEFRTRPIEEYQRLVDQGRLFVNNVPVCSLERLVLNGDNIKHRSLFIELPAGPDNIRILYESCAILVVFKPCGIPCHPQGRYNKLSLTKIIKSEYLSKTDICSTYIHPINRLDRVTSGLVILSKDSTTTKSLSSRVQFAQKYYLAMINGSTSDFISYISKHEIEGVSIKELSPIESHGITTHVIKCEIGLQTLKNREGESLITQIDTSTTGKYSLTYFFPLLSSSKINGSEWHNNQSNRYSILLCKPVTGRTHQIRAHLRHIGFPIVNDILYNDMSKKNGEGTSGFDLANSELSVSCEYNINDLNIGELLNIPLQKRYFAGGGAMTLDHSRCVASVEYSVEPPLGICLHSLLYILPPELPKGRYLIFKCELLPTWVTNNSEINVLEILKLWPHWHKLTLSELEFNPSNLL
ncbi:pseudouridine synthase RluD [Cryptosporidium canis]|uniref:Pseudouridine synthase RluD n=1 Tax=Cryptosporidium canis TaxID=195482 RepID=A0A9D5DJN5_9CRYT|nr:pseudouridine synthase RluD [Cryptosporidium canis]